MLFLFVLQFHALIYIFIFILFLGRRTNVYLYEFQECVNSINNNNNNNNKHRIIHTRIRIGPTPNKSLLISAAHQNAMLIRNLTNLIVNRLKCIWSKYTDYEKIKIVVLDCQILYIVVVLYCYLKVFKLTKYCYLKIFETLCEQFISD